MSSDDKPIKSFEASLQSEEHRAYFQRITRAVKQADELIKEKPHLDYSTIIHTFLCLDLSPQERLAKALSIYGLSGS